MVGGIGAFFADERQTKVPNVHFAVHILRGWLIALSMTDLI